ncbi:MAG: nucleotidyltransferase family protein [Desulfocapsa sp.]|nr:nucleotidyltransferase family protein [Desulfocapsa sp.]
MKTIGSSEFQLLCGCARSRLDEDQGRKIRELAEKDINWEELVTMAAFHNTLPLLYKSLKKACLTEVPEPILQKLRVFFLSNCARCFEMTGELIKVIDLFKKEGIPVAPIKGPLLAETLFGNLTLRSYCDLDLFIPTAKMPSAVNLLASHGYFPDIALDDGQFISLCRAGHHAALVKTDTNLTIELHWELTGRFFRQHVEFEDLEPRLRQASLAGRIVNNLGAEDLLVFLCIHGTRHYWNQLDLVCCVAELIRAETDLDWMLALELAEQLGARKMLFIGLFLARELLDAKLPDQLTVMLDRQEKTKAFTEGIINRLAVSGPVPTMGSSYLQSLVFHFMTMDRLSDFIRYAILRPVFNTTHSDWQQIKLPASLAFLYYLTRPFRLMWKYFRPKGKEER